MTSINKAIRAINLLLLGGAALQQIAGVSHRGVAWERGDGGGDVRLRSSQFRSHPGG